MALTAKKRNVIIGITAVLIFAVVVAALWFSCGSDNKDTTSATTKAPTTSTATQTTKTVTLTTSTAAAAPATDASSGGESAAAETPATPAPSSIFEITERQVNPGFVPPGQPVTFSAWVKGDADSVTMRVNERDSGALVLTVPLTFESHAGSGIYKWSATVAAPMNTGVHRYFASAVSTGGVATEMPGVSGWTFCVGNVVQDCP